MQVGIIVVAAGSGSRLGAERPKAFVEVGGRSILGRSLDALFLLEEPAQIVVVAPETHLDEARAIAVSTAGVAAAHLSVVAGGATRQQSVARGLDALGVKVEVVLVHDAARAFTPPTQFAAVIAAVRATRAGVIPALAVTDTIKRTDASAQVTATLDRAELVAVQTPQGFPRLELVEAYAAARSDETDDAALYAAAGHAVSVIPGDALAFKITTPWDLRRAESLLPVAEPGIRTGVGIDVHAFDDASPLWLGGLYWPGEPGLAGHSDGDAISHALCDALLSAAGLGDIGGRFGTADPRFAGAHGDVFVTETVRLLGEAGFTIGNVAVQVIGQRPRLSARRVEIEEHLAALVGAPVSVSATTSDGLGFTGRTEGVAVIATALVHGAR